MSDALAHLVVAADLIGPKDKPHFAADLLEHRDLLVGLDRILLIGEHERIRRHLRRPGVRTARDLDRHLAALNEIRLNQGATERLVSGLLLVCHERNVSRLEVRRD